MVFRLAQSRPLLLRELRREKSRENFCARAKKHCNRWSRFAKPKSSADGVCVANPKHTIGGQVCKIHRATCRETRGISLSSLLTGLAHLFVLCLAVPTSDRRWLSLLLRSASPSAGMHAFGRAERSGREDLNEPLVPFTAERIGQPAAPLTRRGGFIFALLRTRYVVRRSVRRAQSPEAVTEHDRRENCVAREDSGPRERAGICLLALRGFGHTIGKRLDPRDRSRPFP